MPKSESSSIFLDRWWIRARLVTRSALHVGHGGWFLFKLRGDSKEQEVEVRAVAKDHRGQPMIPGSTLKGFFRDLLESDATATRADPVAALFGTRLVRNPVAADGTIDRQTCGGQLEVHDAFLDQPRTSFPRRGDPPHWSPESQTGIAAGVAIDRARGVAEELKLFHAEFVPAGAGFEVTMTGTNLSRAQVGSLLAILDGAARPGLDLRLGAGLAHGWGRFDWDPSGLVVRRLGPEQVAAWIRAGCPPPREAWPVVTPDEIHRLRAASLPIRPRSYLTFRIRLDFQGPLLVNDPARTGTVRQGRFSRDAMLTPDGRVLLPGSSVHGVLRAQAERILRTLVADAGRDPKAEIPQPGHREVDNIDSLRRQHLVDRLFGISGWRSPLECDDFVGDFVEHTQEFVAIDRFTGGASLGHSPRPGEKESSASGAKFNARAASNPILEGRVRLDLGRLTQVDPDGHALGLLGLLTRDWIEGDLAFGSGSGRGFGRCLATLTVDDGQSWKKWVELSRIDECLGRLRSALLTPPQPALAPNP